METAAVFKPGDVVETTRGIRDIEWIPENTTIKLTCPHNFLGVWRGRGVVSGNERTILVPQDSLRHATA
jgi:hypothetical protein